jgi:hypothetical protein
MIRLSKGNTRWAFILCRYLVIKVPNPRIDWWMHSLKQLRKGRPIEALVEIVRSFYTAILWGVMMNVSEAMLYRYTHNKAHLSAVFTIGIASFQRYEGEERPTQQEIADLYQSVAPDESFDDINCHDSSAHNWRKTPMGLKLIDYGQDPFRTTWARYLKRYQRKLENQAGKRI